MPSERLRWRDVHLTTPFRLTLVLGLLFLGALWATLAFGYLLTARELTARNDRILLERAQSLLTETPADLPDRIRTEIANAAPGFSYFALQSRDGMLLAGNVRLVGRPRPGHAFDLGPKPGEHGPLRILTERTPAGETIILGRDISPIRDLRRRLLGILVLSGLLGTLVVVASAVALSLAPLRRVRDLKRVSRVISAGDLSQRMPVAGRHDELDQFAETVNLMLEQVVHVVAQVKTATDAIAHDLRTPLTRVRASLDRAIQSGELPPAQATIVDQAVVDLDAVIERFAALLRISELEASGRRAGLRQVMMSPLLAELVELYQPVAEDRGIDLDFVLEAMPAVEADPELLFEAIGNLIDNATKFAHSRVLVRAGVIEGVPSIEIIDDGPGIPADEREAVMRRFHRAKGAAGVEGSGLGLAVVNAILHLHGFTLELEDRSPGLLARIGMKSVLK